MRRPGPWLVVLALSACDEPDLPGGPALSVYRETRAGCYALVAGAPSELAERACEVATPGAALLAGIDPLQLVIDYGALDIDDSAIIPRPTTTVLVNGSPSTPAVSTVQLPRTHGRTAFRAFFSAPGTASEHVELSVQVVTGFASILGGLTTESITPALFLLHRTADGCMAPVGRAPPPELGIPTCGQAPETTNVNAAVDPLEIVVDYGAPDIAQTTAIAEPPLAVVVDGVVDTTPITTPLLHRVTPIGPGGAALPDRWYFTAATHAPPAPSRDVRIVSSPDPTVRAELVFSTSPARPELAITECPDAGSCEATAAVGTVELVVALPGDVPQTVTLRETLDGVPRAEALKLTTELDGARTSARKTLDVPSDARDGARWVIAHDLSGSEVEIRLRAPAITAAVTNCTQSCTASAGALLGLTVTAPIAIQTTRALYTTKLDGLPIVSQAALDLVDIDHATQTRSATTTLTAPSSPGQWTIDASVAGYSAATQTITVTP